MPVIEKETPPFRTRKVTKAGVLLFAGATFGVAYEFDDGQRITELSGSKNKAAFDARDRIGDEIALTGRDVLD